MYIPSILGNNLYVLRSWAWEAEAGHERRDGSGKAIYLFEGAGNLIGYVEVTPPNQNAMTISDVSFRSCGLAGLVARCSLDPSVRRMALTGTSDALGLG